MYAELKENHPHGTREYPFCEYHMRYFPHAFQIPVHWHDEMEIIYVRKGPLTVEIDGQKFTGEDDSVFIASPGVLHMMSAPDTPVDYFTFIFPLEFISFQTKDALEDEVFSHSGITPGDSDQRWRIENCLENSYLFLMNLWRRIERWVHTDRYR